MESKFRVEIVNTEEKYRGLRALWCEVFHDEPDFVDGMYECFGADIEAGRFESDEIRGYVVIKNGGSSAPVSALTCFYSGEYEGRPVYTSYAICTRPDMRGLGIAGRLVEHAQGAVLRAGGISLISPAEPSLEQFYGAHGYEPHFYALQDHVLLDDDEQFDLDEEDDEYEKFEPSLDMKELTAEEYNEYREEFLAGRPHVELGESFMKFIYEESKLPDGSSGLYSINAGDAICALTEYPPGMPMLAELILNPALAELSLEIDSEIACLIAKELGVDALRYRMPGQGACQSMTAGVEGSAEDSELELNDAYYGFPID